MILLVACAGSPRGPSPDAWAKARVIAEQYVKQTHGAAASIDHGEPHLPFYFHIKAADPTPVLVDGEHVVTKRGIEALAEYIVSSHMLEYRLANARDFLKVVRLLEAFPPGEKPRGYVDFTGDRALQPRLEYLSKGRVRLVLYYWYEGEVEPGEIREHDGPDSDYVEWTLRVDPGDPTVWTRAMRYRATQVH